MRSVPSHPATMTVPNENIRWIPLATVTEVPPGKATLVRHDRTDILIFHRKSSSEDAGTEGAGEEWTAFDNSCPHAGAPIYAEHFDGECVTCTYHGLRFRASDGGCPEAAGWGLEPYPIKVDGEDVLVGFPTLG